MYFYEYLLFGSFIYSMDSSDTSSEVSILHEERMNIELYRTVYDVDKRYSPSRKRTYSLITEFVSLCIYFRVYTDKIYACWDKNYVYERLNMLAGLNKKSVENICRNREKQRAKMLKHTYELEIILQSCAKSTISVGVSQIKDIIECILEILQQNVHLFARIDPLNRFMKIYRDYYVNTAIFSMIDQLDLMLSPESFNLYAFYLNINPQSWDNVYLNLNLIHNSFKTWENILSHGIQMVLEWADKMTDEASVSKSDEV